MFPFLIANNNKGYKTLIYCSINAKGSNHVPKNELHDRLITYGQMNLIFRARNLWREFVVWSRVYLISRVAGIGMAEDVFNRIYLIPTQFGDIMRLVFGDQAAEKSIQLLSSTVILLRNLVEAIIADDRAAVDQLVRDLYKIADERAAHLASINPFWDEIQWKYLIYTFYSYSFQEIMSILTSDPRNIDLFDRFLQYADTMGVYFSQGLYNYLTYQQPREMLPNLHAIKP